MESPIFDQIGKNGSRYVPNEPWSWKPRGPPLDDSRLGRNRTTSASVQKSLICGICSDPPRYYNELIAKPGAPLPPPRTATRLSYWLLHPDPMPQWHRKALPPHQSLTSSPGELGREEEGPGLLAARPFPVRLAASLRYWTLNFQLLLWLPAMLGF